MLDRLWANLLALWTCSLVAVAVSGCGSASGGSMTATESGGTEYWGVGVAQYNFLRQSILDGSRNRCMYSDA